jgi:hypothetical protein
MSELPALLGDIESIANSGRSFAIVGDFHSAQIVNSTVLVFERSEYANAAIEALLNAFDTDGIQDFLLSAMGSIADEDIKIGEFTADRPDYALNNSPASAFEWTRSHSSCQSSLRLTCTSLTSATR